MAIIDREDPADYSSAHDDLWHMALSDNADTVDFKYIFDVYANNKQLIRAKVFPDPTTKRGYFDVSNVVSNEMIFDWFEPNGNLLMKNLNDSGQGSLTYTVKFGEEVAGVTTLNMSSGQTVALNTSAPLFERRYSNLYLPTSKAFLTNRDRQNIKTDTEETLYIGVIADESVQYQVIFGNSTNLNISSGLLSIADDYMNVKQLDISLRTIEDELGFSMPSNATYYQIRLKDGSSSAVFDSIKVYPDCVPKYESINLHFMNAYGVFDTARFAYASRLTMEAERKTFEKPDYRFGNYVTFYNDYATPIATINKRYYETKVNYGSKFQWSYKLTMDFPSDIDYQWLAELIQSPVVYAEVEVNNKREFYPVGIKSNNYEYSKYINNRLRPFEIEIDMNLKRHGFRR